MKETKLAGGCLCGKIAYSYAGELGPSNYCHCTDCRRTSGSAFAVSVRLAADCFSLISGNLLSHSKVGNSGDTVTRFFCGDCGSPIFSASQQDTKFIYLKAGSLDDADIVEPAYEGWTTSKVRWANIPNDLPLGGKSSK